MRFALAWCTVAGALLLPGCSADLRPLGPTPPGEGIVIYIRSNFVGSSQALDVDVPDLSRVEGPCVEGEEERSATWSDCISSLRVTEGWSVTLYEDRDYRGSSVTLTADTPTLRDIPGPCDDSFNDCVSSITVARR